MNNSNKGPNKFSPANIARKGKELATKAKDKAKKGAEQIAQLPLISKGGVVSAVLIAAHAFTPGIQNLGAQSELKTLEANKVAVAKTFEAAAADYAKSSKDVAGQSGTNLSPEASAINNLIKVRQAEQVAELKAKQAAYAAEFKAAQAKAENGNEAKISAEIERRMSAYINSPYNKDFFKGTTPQGKAQLTEGLRKQITLEVNNKFKTSPSPELVALNTASEEAGMKAETLVLNQKNAEATGESILTAHLDVLDKNKGDYKKLEKEFIVLNQQVQTLANDKAKLKITDGAVQAQNATANAQTPGLQQTIRRTEKDLNDKIPFGVGAAAVGLAGYVLDRKAKEAAAKEAEKAIDNPDQSPASTAKNIDGEVALDNSIQLETPTLSNTAPVVKPSSVNDVFAGVEGIVKDGIAKAQVASKDLKASTVAKVAGTVGVAAIGMGGMFSGNVANLRQEVNNIPDILGPKISEVQFAERNVLRAQFDAKLNSKGETYTTVVRNLRDKSGFDIANFLNAGFKDGRFKLGRGDKPFSLAIDAMISKMEKDGDISTGNSFTSEDYRILREFAALGDGPETQVLSNTAPYEEVQANQSAQNTRDSYRNQKALADALTMFGYSAGAVAVVMGIMTLNSNNKI